LYAISADSTAKVEEDYYMFPIRPNQVNTLAGNMGELRKTHFHAGLDIRTGGQIGLPVYAAADGYISRVGIKSGGYGKALYITHYNGETTVYGHLNKLNGDIGIHVKSHQYSQRNLYLNKYFKKNVFAVKKGQIIAYSGNSGSSAGPHLHFEIRDKNQQVLNPLKYHFEEIRDTTPPIFKKLAITPKNINSRINGVFDREIFTISKKKNHYVLEDTITMFGKVGFELLAFDKLDDANYKCAISEITFEVDGILVFNQKIDTLNFANQRNILKHYNYPAYKSSGDKYHKLYLDDGNLLPFYKTNATKGILSLDKPGIKSGKITIIDVFGNKSILTFSVRIRKPDKDVKTTFHQGNTVKNIENFLVIQQPLTSVIQIEMADKVNILEKIYSSLESDYFLWDLRNGIPNMISNSTENLDYKVQSIIVPDQKYTYYSEEIEATFHKNSLFDTIYFKADYKLDSEKNLEQFNIGNIATDFLKKNINIVLKTKINRPDSIKQKTSVYKRNGNNHSYVGGVWNDNKISFRTRDMGQYTILTDSLAPTISAVKISSNSISFTIKDDLSGIAKFDVFVNNQWMLMDYDYKTSKIWSEPLTIKDLEGEVRLRVVDNAGNEQLFFSEIP
jgi:hypothetical protein